MDISNDPHLLYQTSKSNKKSHVDTVWKGGSGRRRKENFELSFSSLLVHFISKEKKGSEEK